MFQRLVPAAPSAVGLFLVVAAAAALTQHAPQSAVVFGVLGAAHLAVAAEVAAGSRLAAAIGAGLGVVTGLLVGAGLWFIAGIEAGVGVDLGAAWFAPLSGYATIAVAAALLIASVILIVGGLAGARRGSARKALDPVASA